MSKNVSAVGYFFIGEIDILTPVAIKQLVNCNCTYSINVDMII